MLRWWEVYFLPMTELSTPRAWTHGNYGVCRLEGRENPSFVLNEGGSPPERWLQQIWRHQRLQRTKLVALDGRPVRVLHPGFWNREPGPDFKDAVIQLGSGLTLVGDVEVDLHPAGWFGHGHATNPAYDRVVLQVVWEPGSRPVDRAVVAVSDVLDCPLEEMAPWLEDEAIQRLPVTTQGRCCGPLSRVDRDRTEALLDEAARVRLNRKVAEFAARGRSVGWETVLWEGVFGALGYRENSWPMRRLAEIAARQLPKGNVLVCEAMLFGIAGLLPPGMRQGEGSAYVQGLWDIWWEEQAAWKELILPRKAWRIVGVRPLNHPQRRLALAARWIADPTWINRVRAFLNLEGKRRTSISWFVRELCDGFNSTSEAFWRSHWTLRAGDRSGLLPWIGPARATDLAINVFLPWMIAEARMQGDEDRALRLERRWMEWPKGQDNGDFKFARRRLWAGGRADVRWTAARQQGLLQVRRDFCLAAGSLCTGCRFPSVVGHPESEGKCGGL